MTSMRIVALSALAALLALASPATGANAGVELTEPQYIAKADALCRAADEKVTKLGPLFPASRAAAVGGKVLAIDRSTLAALRALTPPTSKRAAVARVLRLADIAINTGVAGAVAAAKSGQTKAFYAAAKRAQMLIDKAHAAARSFGLSACASW